MKLSKKALLYDISNMAYLIADTGEPLNHTLHRVRDICEDGNIDRVSRILGLAYAKILDVLAPVSESRHIKIDRDLSVSPHNYEIRFSSSGRFRFTLTSEKKLKIKEIAHEYMVCMVLCDWLEVTLPVAADVWKYRAESALDALENLVATVMYSSSSTTLRRRISPF